jgi:hypothetical protein
LACASKTNSNFDETFSILTKLTMIVGTLAFMEIQIIDNSITTTSTSIDPSNGKLMRARLHIPNWLVILIVNCLVNYEVVSHRLIHLDWKKT